MNETNETLKKIPIYYIIGIGRSGTSMFSSICNQHKKLWASPETTFLLFFYQAFKHKKNFTEQDIDLICAYINLQLADSPPIGWSFSQDKLRQSLLALAPNTDYPTFCKAIYVNFVPAERQKNIADIAYIIDKNPSYTLQWHHLWHFDPQHPAKFIVMIRDYRANILSRRQSINNRNPNTATDAYRWLFFNQRIKKLLKTHDKQTFLLPYEHLIAQPEEALKKVCLFLEIDYEPQMLQFHKRDKQVYEQNNTQETLGHSRFQKKYGDLAKPIYTGRLRAWQTELPLQDRLVAEYICGNLGKQFGYENTLKINFIQKIRLSIKTFIPFCKAFYDIYKDYILFYVSPNIKMKRILQLKKRK